MKPKGHKRGCRCVVCANIRNKNGSRRVRHNHGYENQVASLHARAARKTTRKNSTVPLGGTVRMRSASKRLSTKVNPVL